MRKITTVAAAAVLGAALMSAPAQAAAPQQARGGLGYCWINNPNGPDWPNPLSAYSFQCWWAWLTGFGNTP